MNSNGRLGLRIRQYAIGVFFCTVAYLFLSWPVGGFFSDSDLWYHLSGGRYFFAHFEIPGNSYFSYISPAKNLCNYYWLFQVVVYAIYHLTSYYGLIIFKTILYLLTISIIWRYLVCQDTANQNTPWSMSVLAALYALAIVPRELFLIRPHLFSYLFIVCLIFIIEHKRSLFWLLPVICLAWGNLHGIEYPIPILIIIAYLFEMAVNKFRSTPSVPAFTRGQRLTLIFSMYLIFITPAGLSLLRLPFELSPFLEQSINEMAPLNLASFLKFSFSPVLPVVRSIQNCIILFGVVTCIVLVFWKAIRVSHLILFLGAITLLSLNRRFIYESILLMLPLVSMGVVRLTEVPSSVKSTGGWILGMITLLILPLVFTYHISCIKPRYPFSYQGFPIGIANFLNHINSGGRILNEHNTGGFMHWRVHPKYQIFMDLQNSMFDINDLHISAMSRKDVTVLNRFIGTYVPSFICVHHTNKQFAEIIADSQKNNFVPVFFDDSEILYANRNHLPEIVGVFGLKHIDPFKTMNLSYETMDPEHLTDVLKELMRMQTIYPFSALINTMITNVLLNLEESKNIMPYAERVIQYHPENYIGYALKGQILFARGQYQESIQFFIKARKKPLGKTDAALTKNLHMAYSKIHEYKKAYQVLRKSINVLDEKTNYKDLYTLGIYAAAAGKKNESMVLLKFAETRTPPTDTEYMQKIKNAHFWE